jgi:hypothetical protein
MKAAAAAAFALAALLLRWPIASHDVEHYPGPDEGEVVENVIEMIRTGDYDHRHPGYPGLHFYLQRASLVALSATDGRPLVEIPRSEVYLRARRLTLIAGAATAAVVFLIGGMFLSSRASGLAAALTALSPLAFRESSVVNPDLLLALLVALSLLAALSLEASPTGGRFLAAGITAGLATAVKYTGAFTLLPCGAAALLTPGEKRKRARWMIAGLGAALAVFALSSPYTFVNWLPSGQGLARHVGYYQASGRNAAIDVVTALAGRGLGWPAAIAAAMGAAVAIAQKDRNRMLVLSFPIAYLLLFSFFDRAYPRHALPLLPGAALLAGAATDRLSGRRFWALAMVLASVPAYGSLSLRARAARSSPAERAQAWALSTLPEKTRILEDQWTPGLPGSRFRVHRMQVEEQVFVGNFDWVFYSGYPPGIDVTGLREVKRFETEDALGSAITVYQVPDRAALMGTTLAPGKPSVRLGAGELPFFGEGFDPPKPGAYGTERLSRGRASEIFFVLPERGSLSIELSIAAAASAVELSVELNDQPLGRISIDGEEPGPKRLEAPGEITRKGLNRLVLRYDATERLSRRNREAAVRLYEVALTRR